MRRIGWRYGVALAVVWFGLLLSAGAAPERLRAPTPIPPRRPQLPRFEPKFEAVAETRLLMEGLAQSNFRGLEQLLKEKPDDDETWKFARGQALLIAETGNLLLLRPPRNQGRDRWMKEAMDLRQAAGNLARSLGNRDYARSRAGLSALANACNHCHETFRVPTRVKPNLGTPERKTGLGA